MIAGHFRLAHAFIRLGHYDQAEHVTATALDALAPVEHDPDAAPEALSPLGAMHLVTAVICGHENNRPRARTHLADARRLAERIGTDRNRSVPGTPSQTPGRHRPRPRAAATCR